MRKTYRLLVTAICLVPSMSLAELRMPSFFSNDMVLQRDQPLPLWGWADAGETVTVTLGSQSASTKADNAGNWRIVLKPLPMSTEGISLKIKAADSLEFSNILLGDIWLCSGQSNMDWGLGSCDVPDDIAAADFPAIRHFRTEYNFANAPEQDAKGRWVVCNPQNAPGFSAVGFYFARKISSETGVPIGLVTNAVGGTNIELWMQQETLLNTPSLDSYASQMRESLANYQKQLSDALPLIDAWSDSARAAQNSGKQIPLPPKWPEFPFSERVMRPRCVTLHNGHIAPFIPMAMRGVLWYQGESNADDTLYLEKKQAMIADWRKWFTNEKLPFYFVQLASWQAPDENPEGGGWGRIRDIQRKCLEIPYTGMASAIDIGDAADIHPKNKADVGERLALWALANEYGKPDTITSGPLFDAITITNDRLHLKFKSIGGGLIIGSKSGRGPATEVPNGTLKRFAIAGEDRKWAWAEAVISGDTVILRSPEVPNPVAARYAYSMNPEGSNLYNRAGLPASPFRTDNW